MNPHYWICQQEQVSDSRMDDGLLLTRKRETILSAQINLLQVDNCCWILKFYLLSGNTTTPSKPESSTLHPTTTTTKAESSTLRPTTERITQSKFANNRITIAMTIKIAPKHLMTTNRIPSIPSEEPTTSTKLPIISTNLPQTSPTPATFSTKPPCPSNNQTDTSSPCPNNYWFNQKTGFCYMVRNGRFCLINNNSGVFSQHRSICTVRLEWEFLSRLGNLRIKDSSCQHSLWYWERYR